MMNFLRSHGFFYLFIYINGGEVCKVRNDFEYLYLNLNVRYYKQLIYRVY